MNCYCGRNQEYSKCCEPIIKGKQEAKTAEDLMRSRYSAYAAHEIDYIINTSAPELQKQLSKEETQKWAEQSKWLKLEIMKTEKGSESDEDGFVDFTAHYMENGIEKQYREYSHFIRINKKWIYEDGKVMPIRINKIGRNDPCTCGSGKKYKKCCGKDL